MLKLLFIMLLMAPILAVGAVDLFNIKTDKNVYEAHEQALVVTNILTQPQNSNFEVIIKSNFNSHEVKATKVSNTLFISALGDIGDEGEGIFKSAYYLRDKNRFQQYEEAIQIAEIQISRYIRERREASEPRKIEINELISIEEGKIDYYLSKQNDLLRLVEEKTIVITVEAIHKSANSSFIFLNTDRSDDVFHPGEELTVLAHVYTNVEDKAPVVKASWGANALTVTPLANNEFFIQSDTLTSGQIGPQELIVSLYFRDKLRGERLEEALRSIEVDLQTTLQNLSRENDPVKKHGLQKRINDLVNLKSFILSLLESLESLIEVTKQKFSVEASL